MKTKMKRGYYYLVIMKAAKFTKLDKLYSSQNVRISDNGID